MYFWFDTINFLFALGGVALIPLTVLLYADYFLWSSRYYKHFVEKYVWLLITALTVGSVCISLLYSEYYGFVPCSLCWLQRIAIYPQALMVICAYSIKDKRYFPMYGIALSLFGLCVAVYQYIYQLVPKEVTTTLMPCLADGTADCGARVIDEFGFVTFPFLSAITFVLLIVLYLHMRRGNK